MPDFFDAGGEATSSTGISTPATQSVPNKYKQAVISAFPAASAPYGSLLLKVRSECTSNTGNPSCQVQYSTNASSSWTQLEGGNWPVVTDSVPLSPSQDLTQLRVRYCVESIYQGFPDPGADSSTLTGYDIRTEGILTPSAPSNLAIASSTSTSVNLTWTDGVAETSYSLERCSGAGCSNFAQVATPAANSTSYHDPNLTPSTSYSYRIRGSNGSGFSPYSNLATGTTQEQFGLGTPFTTIYKYDGLDRLLCVEQHGDNTSTGCAAAESSDATSTWRVRRFEYNTAGQLLRAKNPESGVITYKYDADGNVIVKKSPAPNQTGAATVTINYTYDLIHRLTGKTYTGITETAVAYNYDEPSAFGLSPITNPKGWRTSMSDASGTTSWSFDEMGRVKTERRTIGSVTKTTGYTYNLDGTVATIVYPNPSSNRTITYDYNAAGQPISAVDIANSINYATSAHYRPSSALASMVTGSSATSGGVNHTFTFNSRLQPVRIIAQAVGAASPVFDLTYDFHLGAGNNGNVFSITNNRDTTRSQIFTYDDLNRLKSAETTSSNLWANSFQYDPWGNLNKILPFNSKPEGQHLDQLSNGKNQLIGFSYDAAGNLMANASATYTYDAENRLKTAGGVTYTYDGDGERVKKSSGTLYWRGMQSDALSESDLAGAVTREFIFFNGKRIAFRTSAQQYRWYLSDHLGSSRKVISAAAGNTYEDADFYPYGGERTFVASSSGNNYKFTGKERDQESNLDYFGARYYGSTLGRFISVDPKALTVRHLVNPQKWNRYSYTLNNPLSYFDPDGMEEVTITVRAFIPVQQTIRVGRYEGDNRGFSTGANASARASVRVKVETDPKVQNNPLLSSEVTTGKSVLRREDGSVIRSGNARDGLPSFNVSRDEKGNVAININQDVKNPIAPGPAKLTPGVSADLKITVSSDASAVTVVGTHSQYPALEINAQVSDNSSTPVYQFMPSDPGDPTYLTLPNVNVFTNKILPPQPPRCAIDKETECK